MILGTIESILSDIASMLRRERLQRNLSQQTVAERSGLSLSAVKNLEMGKDGHVRAIGTAPKILDQIRSVFTR